MTMPLVVLAVALVVAGVGYAGVSLGKRLYLSGNQQRMLPVGPAQRSALAIDLVNEHVEIYRGRAVRVLDESISIVYSRKNGTKGRVTFKMDRAFENVREGDTGVLVSVDQEEVGATPFYKFVRDAGTPDIADVLEVGTGDTLTDDIYRALRESREA